MQQVLHVFPFVKVRYQ